MEKAGDWAYDEIAKRPFLKLAVHGFKHSKRECRFEDQWRPGLKILDRVTADPRWSRIFKGPWNGMSEGFLQELIERDYMVCCNQLYGFPFPMPDVPIWSCSCALAAHYSQVQHEVDMLMAGQEVAQSGKRKPGERDGGLHVISHPVYPSESRAKAKAARTEINSRRTKRWASTWERDDEWKFVDELTRPAALKIVLGCGDIHVWENWACLDPRSHIDPRIIEWDFTKMIPFSELKADIVFTSHVFNYVADDKYVEAILDIWRVLRPGGVYRMQEDRTDSGFIWRKKGSTRTDGQGMIMSEPTREKIYAAMNAVGFEIHDLEPGKTLSPHTDVLRGDNRGRKWTRRQKFYAEGVKVLADDFDISRPRRRPWCRDWNATKIGRYKLPEDQYTEEQLALRGLPAPPVEEQLARRQMQRRKR